MKNNSHNQSREGLRLQHLSARFQAFEYGYYAKSPTPAVGQDLVSAFCCQYNLALSLAPNPQPMQQTPQCCKCWHHSHSKLLTFLPLGSFLLVDRRASRLFPIFRTLRSGLRVCSWRVLQSQTLGQQHSRPKNMQSSIVRGTQPKREPAGRRVVSTEQCRRLGLAVQLPDKLLLHASRARPG